MDLLSRSTIAIAVYIVILPTIFYPFGLYETETLLAWVFTLASATVSLIRLTHLRLTEKFYDRYPKLWMNIFKTCSLTHSAILSALFALANYSDSFKVAYTAVLVVCAGMSSGAISSLSPNLFLAISFPQILLVPSIVTLFYKDMASVGITILVYASYLTALAVRTNKEYLRTFEIEETLKFQKKELETLSRTDAMTGLVNRGYFNNLYEMLWESCTRNNSGITLMMIDIDHFKSVNDNYGHTSGDTCIKVIAQCLKNGLRRKTDICCRYGGEEFAVLLGSTPGKIYSAY